MFYKNLKKIIKRSPVLWEFLRQIKDSLIILSRLNDVLMMMIMFHIWPEQTYRFSTRKYLPKRKNKFSKESKPIIPYDLLKSKSSSIPIMKEINVVGVGSSFNLNNLKYLEGPIFLLPFWGPLKMDDSGKSITLLSTPSLLFRTICKAPSVDTSHTRLTRGARPSLP